ncbi:MAG: GNAT family N-acetyltransferase [Acidimicrobiia bacterium]|nr:GNAT family N-acetyltransferase [Acidimicrobiia bacterium]
MAGFPQELRAPGLLLRRYRAGDAAPVHAAALESAAEVSPYETWCHEGYTLAEAAEYAAWWDQAWDKGSAHYYAVCDETTGHYLGSCGLCPVEREHATAGLGFWVRTPDTGRGVATTAARLVAQAGFDHLGLNRIELLIAVQNTASRRVADKLGASYEGTLRKRLVLPAGPTDMAMYALVR